MKCDNCGKKVSSWNARYGDKETVFCKDCFKTPEAKEIINNNKGDSFSDEKSSNNHKDWFFSKTGEEYKGPVGKEFLISKLRDDELTENTLVWTNGMPDWEKLSEVTEFEDLFDEVTPPPLPKNKDNNRDSTDFHKELLETSTTHEDNKRNKNETQSNQLDELPQQIKCPICETNVELTNKDKIKKEFWCPTCERFMDISIVERYQEANPQLFQDETNQSEKNSTSNGENNLENQDPLTHKWLKFYTNIRIPFSIFFTLVGAYNVTTIPSSQTDILKGISAVIVLVYAILFWGLYKRELWGWRLNWGFIFLEPILGVIGFSTDPSQILIALLVGLLIYTYPNYVYFKKRKYLFLN